MPLIGRFPSMNRSLFHSLLCSLLFGVICPSKAFAEDCSANQHEVPLRRALASASSWENLRNSAVSLRFMTRSMIAEAKNSLSLAEKPQDLCSPPCQIMENPWIVFRATPHRFLTGDADAEVCKHMLQQTRDRPFNYKERGFDDLDSFSAWYNDFSTGKGKDGADLYRRCPGTCSPQYTTTLLHRAGKLVANAEVICGPARDKSDNLYDLSTSYRWSCK